MSTTTKKKIFEILAILFGNFLLALSVEFFVLPYDILSGGVAGVAVIVTRFVNVDPNLVIDIAVIALFIIGAIILGREFAMKTFLCSLTYPFFLRFLSPFVVDIQISKLLACIYGGVIAGIGIGIVLRYNASTGGTDIPPLVIHKYTGWSIPVLMWATDAIICLAGFVAYGLEDILLGIIYIYVYTYALNKVVAPKTDEAISLQIISDKRKEICDYVHDVLERGSTIMPARGGYTNSEKEVILTIVYKNQYRQLLEFIEQIDPTAFVIVSTAKDVKGEGFSYYAPRV